MAALSRWKFLTDNLAAKILSLAIASVFWLSVTVDKEIQKNFSAPLIVVNLPPGFTISDNVPHNINFTVTGPEILFLSHNLDGLKITLDLRKTGEGTVSFPHLQKYIDLPYGMQVIRVYPSSLELKLVRRKN
jgi:YbbR domain-containing protein